MQGKRTANRRAAALRQALMLSISSMLVCAMMLVGMTYAWFTDSAVTAVNAIHTGTVNADLMYKASDGSYRRLAQKTSLFADTTNSPWAPGHIEIKYLKIVNNGTLPIRYSLGVNAAISKDSKNAQNAQNEDYLLSELKYAFVKLDSANATIKNSDVTGATSSTSQPINLVSLANAYGNSPIAELGTLTASGTDGSKDAYYAFIIYYPGTATNNTTNIPVTIGLRLLAIQQKNTDSATISEGTGPWADAANTEKTSNSMPETESTSTSNSTKTSDN